jgi:hypothetical protein
MFIATSSVKVLRRPLESAQGASEQFQRLMVDNGVDCSMSRAGNVGDKATMAMTPNVRLSLNYTAFGMADSISAAPL